MFCKKAVDLIAKRKSSRIIAIQCRQRDRMFDRGLKGFANGLVRKSSIRSDKFRNTVHDHLRRVCIAIENCSIFLLSFRKRGLAEWILPAKSVPVVNVEREREYLLIQLVCSVFYSPKVVVG